VELANGAAVDARKKSRDLQDLLQAEERGEKKKKKAEEGASKKATTTNKRKPSGKENGHVKLRKKKTGNKKSKAGTIVATYGHELYRGKDHTRSVVLNGST
jgi:hypothetical protein